MPLDCDRLAEFAARTCQLGRRAYSEARHEHRLTSSVPTMTGRGVPEARPSKTWTRRGSATFGGRWQIQTPLTKFCGARGANGAEAVTRAGVGVGSRSPRCGARHVCRVVPIRGHPLRWCRFSTREPFLFVPDGP